MILARRCRSRGLCYIVLALFITVFTILRIVASTRKYDDAEEPIVAVRDEVPLKDESLAVIDKRTALESIKEYMRRLMSARPGLHSDSLDTQTAVDVYDADSDADESDEEYQLHTSIQGNEASKAAADVVEHDDKHPWAPKQFDYRQIFSLTSADRKFISIFYGGVENAYNPNIIPHPTNADMWIVVAQKLQFEEHPWTFAQLVCPAGFLNGVLICAEEPKVLPVTSSIPGTCKEDLSYFNFRNGPRDGRMFYGPDAPYIVYGSQSAHTCLGLWFHDARMILEAFRIDRYMGIQYFKSATEVQRPAPWRGIEKNYFIFWDLEGKAYAHYDLWPKRSFGQIDADGSVVGGTNLALKTEVEDQLCMARLMPEVWGTQESIHQASNTLRITTCRRVDSGCMPSAKNTFLLHIFHHKTFYDFHGVYEPFAILFQTIPPFAIHAISQRPFWINGRSALTNMTGSQLYSGREDEIPEGHTELFYVTSISWRTHGQKYHGYIDDVVFIQFGIEDTRSGTIDVIVGDILQDLAMC